jgi:hemin uptake protein HemP
MTSGTDDANGAHSANGSASPACRRDSAVPSDALFGAGDVLLIDHNGATYRLRKTRLGKLILTK